jgi:hypothetical protein
MMQAITDRPSDGSAGDAPIGADEIRQHDPQHFCILSNVLADLRLDPATVATAAFSVAFSLERNPDSLALSTSAMSSSSSAMKAQLLFGSILPPRAILTKRQHNARTRTPLIPNPQFKQHEAANCDHPVKALIKHQNEAPI